MTYTFLLNRFQLLRRNGWVNDFGEVFVIFPRKELARELRICEQRVTAAFKKLVELKLVWEKRCGRGDANQIYLASVEPMDNPSYSSAPFVPEPGASQAEAPPDSSEELDCVVTNFDPDKDELQISVKATQSNPFDGAEQRHPVGSRRYATIAGKYGGGVFRNLPDGTVCMCNYSYQYEDSDFLVGDTVILLVQRHEREKRQMYGKILSKW